LTDVSEHSICSIFQIICLEDGTDIMFRNVGQYKPDVGETPTDSTLNTKHGESLKSRKDSLLEQQVTAGNSR
jgi:hypothetical protein